MVPIAPWLVRTACRQVRKWHEAGPGRPPDLRAALRPAVPPARPHPRHPAGAGRGGPRSALPGARPHRYGRPAPGPYRRRQPGRAARAGRAPLHRRLRHRRRLARRPPAAAHGRLEDRPRSRAPAPREPGRRRGGDRTRCPRPRSCGWRWWRKASREKSRGPSSPDVGATACAATSLPSPCRPPTAWSGCVRLRPPSFPGARGGLDHRRLASRQASPAAGASERLCGQLVAPWDSPPTASTPARPPIRAPGPSPLRSSRPPPTCRRASANTRATSTRGPRTRPGAPSRRTSAPWRVAPTPTATPRAWPPPRRC